MEVLDENLRRKLSMSMSCMSPCRCMPNRSWIGARALATVHEIMVLAYGESSPWSHVGGDCRAFDEGV